MIERVTIRRPAKIDDEYHGKQIVWLDIAEVWAQVEPISSREYFFGQANQAEATHKIKIRYRPDIGQGWQIKHRDAYYSVQSMIDMGGRRRFLELLCIDTKETEETAQTYYDGGPFTEEPSIPLDCGSFEDEPDTSIDLGEWK